MGSLSLGCLCPSGSQGPSSRQAEGQAEQGGVLAGWAGRELILGRECSLQPGHHPSPVPSTGPGSPQHTTVPVSPALLPSCETPQPAARGKSPGASMWGCRDPEVCSPQVGSPFAAVPGTMCSALRDFSHCRLCWKASLALSGDSAVLRVNGLQQFALKPLVLTLHCK